MIALRLSEKAKHLRQVPLFQKLSRGQLERVASIVDQVTIKPSAHLTEQGGRGLEFFIVLQGHAHADQSGRRVNELGPGDFFGEISLLDGRPRTATVIADTEMELLVVHKNAFDELRRDVPGLTDQLLEALLQRLG